MLDGLISYLKASIQKHPKLKSPSECLLQVGVAVLFANICNMKITSLLLHNTKRYLHKKCVNHQTSLHTYISPQSFQATKETKKTLKQTKEYPVQHAKNKVLLQQWKQISPLSFNFSFHTFLCCPCPPPPNTVLKKKKKKKKKKKLLTLENLEKDQNKKLQKIKPLLCLLS